MITNAEINRIVTAEELWHRISGLLGEEADAQAITWDEFALGYLESEGTAVFIAATNLDPHEFKIRKVRDWSEYDVVGSASFPLSALRGSP